MQSTGEDAQWHPKYKLLNTRFVSATHATLPSMTNTVPLESDAV